MEATTFTSNKDTNGYVGYYPTDNEIVVAFSGTNPFDIQEWIDDLDFFKTTYPYCSGCNVHEGFYKTFLAAKDNIFNLTNSYLAQHPTASVTCTGHSLGAGISHLFT
jgi:predicted lipase